MGWRRLTGLDATFLYAETESAPLHVLGMLLLDPAGCGANETFARIRRRIERRLPALPVLRRKLVEVPWGLDHPLWADDPDFDLDLHLRRVRLPKPGGERELDGLVARLAERPLPRDRPLWEICIADGLAGRRLALIAKIHHAAVDGLGAVGLLAGLLDADPDAPDECEAAAPEPADATPPPSALELLAGASLALGLRPLRGARELWRSAGLGARLVTDALSGRPGALGAPRSRLNACISGRRAVATGAVAMEQVKTVKDAFAATVNHVILAACAGALRRYLGEHGGIPREPLIAAVPMALGGRPGDGAGNALSVLRVPLPVHLADALDRLHAAREASREAIAAHETRTADTLACWAELAAPALVAGAAKAYTYLGLAAHHPPFHNVVISNVPGPAHPLYCAGARVAACRPFGPLYDGSALNITVVSYAGWIGFGATACPDALPEVEKIPRAFEESVAQLARLATREGPEFRRLCPEDRCNVLRDTT